MSQRRPPPPKPPAPPPPSDDEEEDEELDEFDDGSADIFEVLGSLFATEDGETIATIHLRQAEAVEKIAAQFETQNKILVKILSELKSNSCKCPPAAASETIEP
jgi:hypothetical protein